MRRKAYSFAMRGLMALSVAITCGFALFIILYVLCKGLPNITWQLLSTSPSILNDRIGILPDILNTLYLILAALAVVLPLGVGAAVYLTEYASSKGWCPSSSTPPRPSRAYLPSSTASWA